MEHTGLWGISMFSAGYPDPHAGDPEGVVDPGRMQDLVDNLGDGLQDVIESYLEDTPMLIEEMREAVERGDWEDLSRIAHSLKSSSGIFGAKYMVELCRAIEAAARERAAPEERTAQVSRQLRELAEAYEKVRAVLRTYLES